MKKQGNVSYAIYIPENMDIESLLRSSPLDIPHAKDYLNYIMHLIHATTIYLNDADIEDTGGYTILNSVYLQKRIRYYTLCLDWLIDNDVLECNGHYVPRLRSKGYRFKAPYTVRVKKAYITTPTLVKSIKLTQRKVQPKLRPEDLPGCHSLKLAGDVDSYSELAKISLSYLNKWLADRKLDIDIDRANNFLGELFAKEALTQYVKFPLHRLNQRMILVDQIHEHQVRFHVDDTYLADFPNV
jgi:hypothetical protein